MSINAYFIGIMLHSAFLFFKINYRLMVFNYKLKCNTLFRLNLVVVMLCCFAGIANAQVVFPYGETFKNSTATGVVFGGGTSSEPAKLTGTGTAIDGITDAVGSGYLRLTNQSNDQAGFARSTKKFPSRYGITTTFEYYIWNSGSPSFTADGLSFFLFDATASSAFNIGGFGGSLGYAQRNTPSVVAGLSKGFLGVGLDVFGNFATESEGRQGGNTTSDANNRSNVTLRGDGNGSATDATNYEFLVTKRTTGENGAVDGGSFDVHGDVNGRDNGVGGLTPTNTGYRKAKIEIIPVSGAGNTPDTTVTPTKYKVNVWITTGAPGGATEHRVINDYIYTPTSAVPDSLSYGFAASTGGFQNYHEIRGLDIVAPSVFEFKPVLANVSVSVNEDVTYTFTTANFQSGFLDPNGITTLTEVKIESLPANGTLKLSGTNITVNQVIPVANLPNITFVPNANWHGSTSFTWNGKDATSYATTSKSVNITVNSVNDAPSGANATIGVPQNATDHVITASNFGFSDSNDSSPGPVNTLSAVKIVAIPTTGTLELNNIAVTAGQEISVTDINDSKLTYTPVTSGSGAPYTTFTFQVKDNGGTSNSGVDLDPTVRTLTINVAARPTFTLSSASSSICSGTASTNLTFSATTGTPNRYNIDWTSGITDVNDVTFSGSTMTISGLGSIAAGTYTGTLTIYNVDSKVMSTGTTVTLTINSSAQPSTITGSTTVCIGKTGETYTVTNVSGSTYSWTYSGTGATITAGSNTNSITVSYSSTATSGTWSVTATKDGCTSTARTLDITVNSSPQPSAITGNASICAASTGIVYSVTSVANTSYSWTYSGTGATIASGGGTNSITVNYASNATTGTWSVVATGPNSCPSIARTFAVTTVNITPTVADITGGSSIASGGTTTLASTTTGGSWSSSNTSIATVNSSGVVTGVAAGSVTITYTVTSSGCSASKTKAITVTAGNSAPVAVADSYSVARSATLTVPANGVLSNDTDADGNTLTAIKVLAPNYGSLTLNSNGSFVYQHGGGTQISDSFTYKVNDGTVDGNTVTVTISITGITNTAPLAQTDNYNVGYLVNTVISAPGVLSNDTDVNNNTLTAIKVTNPLNGNLVAFNSDGSFTYQHTSAAATSDSFTYKVNDGIVDGNTVTVNLTIVRGNQAPVAFADTYGLTRGSTLSVAAPGVMSNDTDPDGDPITATRLTNPAFGTLSFNSNGSFTYVHGGGTNTSDSFTYKVNDGKIDGNTVTVNLPIALPGTAPVIADVSKVTAKNIAYTFSSNDFTEKFVDLLHSLVKIRIVGLPSIGSLKLSGIDVRAGQEINASDLPNLIYTPGLDFTGSISFQYNASCPLSYALANRNVNISVIDPGVPPVAVADKLTTTRGGTITLALPGLLGNDTDSRGLPLTAIKVTEPTHGSVVLNANGSMVYIHDNGSSTKDSFTYKANNGFSDSNIATVTVSIPFVNQPPVLSTLTKNGFNANPIQFTLQDFVEKFSDSDTLVSIRIATLPVVGTLKLNGIPVTPGQVIVEANIDKLSFEPPRNWNGTTSFFWNASDGTQFAVNNALVNITVTQPSDPNSKIGLAKHLDSTKPNVNGSYDLKFIFTVVNYGPNELVKVSVKDNLALAFSGAEFSVKGVKATGNLRANTGFTGIGDTELLQSSSKLIGNEEAKIELDLNVKLKLAGGTFFNSATAEGESQITGFKVNDVSTNGIKPDPLQVGDVSPSDATQIKLDLLPSYVPPAFSPNGDGVNDKFVVQNADGKNVSLEMYNRWGNRVYKSDDYKNDWGGEVTEGFFLGSGIPDGTYYYIIIIDRKDKYVGFITVNR